jgi:DNA-binding MarR family transcriptional regulator
MSEEMYKGEEPDYAKYVPFAGRDYNLRMLLYLTEMAVNEARHAQVTEIGLTRGEADLLFLVQCLGESATPASLSRWLNRKPPTISEHLDHMQAKGLLKRQAMRGDNKSKRVVLTRKGQALLQRAMEHDIIATIMRSLSEEEHQELWHLLEKLKDSALAQSQQVRTMSSKQT